MRKLVLKFISLNLLFFTITSHAGFFDFFKNLFKPRSSDRIAFSNYSTPTMGGGCHPMTDILQASCVAKKNGQSLFDSNAPKESASSDHAKLNKAITGQGVPQRIGGYSSLRDYTKKNKKTTKQFIEQRFHKLYPSSTYNLVPPNVSQRQSQALNPSWVSSALGGSELCVSAAICESDRASGCHAILLTGRKIKKGKTCYTTNDPNFGRSKQLCCEGTTPSTTGICHYNGDYKRGVFITDLTVSPNDKSRPVGNKWKGSGPLQIEATLERNSRTQSH